MRWFILQQLLFYEGILKPISIHAIQVIRAR